jgi:predicted nucleic acid-binding protein
MNLIDSSGWLEYFIGGKNAAFFAPAIEDPENIIVPTISLFEVFKRVLIEKNRDDALEAIALMKEGRVIDLNDSLALTAGELAFDLKLPLADSIILATAQEFNATLYTQDVHYKNIEGVRYIEKKGSK